ncbi:FUSC family protein [Chryseobacterium gotjawalense]|uniref:FUSC family protein n=1 Tax=Chryseobacterium gotjawalense TaxID=3042315 RepID=A0ABY8RG55_9FLAO|nr:FUSC family protein [Chryseobacterium sp. wdc7]WHF52846.1 FUSC family protein [Chryseobacterium sp. wdc7]
MRFQHQLNDHVKSLVEIKKTERLWHFPFLAGICVGVCLFIGWYFQKPAYGNLASIGALVILYFTQAPLAKRMIHLCVCAFGFTLSFALGSVLSFNPYVSAAALGLIAFLAHLISTYFDIPPPGNFFFIMIGAVAISLPFEFESIPVRVGLVSMGAMLSVCLAFFYSVFIAKKAEAPKARRVLKKKRYTGIVESLILAVAMFSALLTANILEMKSAYWIPVSALAIMQGKDLLHTRQRNLHRIIGTFIGMGVTWIILILEPKGLALVLIIAGLQFVIELIVVRNYGLAVIFITPLTIFLAENSSGAMINVNELMGARILDTVIGSLIGLAAGWFLHHHTLIATIEKKIRGTKMKLNRN